MVLDIRLKIEIGNFHYYKKMHFEGICWTLGTCGNRLGARQKLIKSSISGEDGNLSFRCLVHNLNLPTFGEQLVYQSLPI